MIGIILADENEIHQIPGKILAKQTKGPFQFVNYLIAKKEVVVVCSGIGIANAAAALQAMIDFYQPQVIYNYGAVGASDKLQVYDLIIPKKIFFHDVITPWYPRGQVPGQKHYYTNAALNPNKINLASGMTFLTSKEEIKKINFDIEADIFDMEAAAMMQIATLNKIPMMIIKCVSDIIGSTSPNHENINLRIAKAGQIALKKTLTLIFES